MPPKQRAKDSFWNKLCTGCLVRSQKWTEIIQTCARGCHFTIGGARALLWSEFNIFVQNHVRENYWNSGVQIPAPKGHFSYFFCSFLKSRLHKKQHIFLFNPFWISCFTNIFTHIFNMFYLISKQQSKISKNG